MILFEKELQFYLIQLSTQMNWETKLDEEICMYILSSTTYTAIPKNSYIM